ncbi:helix-turn-helix transcriptional regulator [Salinibacterium sp.]|uniref:PadR family transcriptional regulator n=1 Tax=Salinibacterium sp. TaxID=1915057 RepID=UPI002869EFCB|nr:helix-turn-helix transcriptional regulator [Salinibacterium sp.]
MQQLSRITPATINVLQCLLAGGATWGLLVIKQSGRPAGSVYPILERLERAGWVTSEWDDDTARPGPRRRLYCLTSDGAISARHAVRSRPAVASIAGATA